MKKHRLKQKVIKELTDNPNVSMTCEKLNISRQTFYRWTKEDEDFSKQVEESMILGNDLLNDVAEMKLMSKVKEGNMTAIKYRLDNNKYNYIKPRHTSFWDSFKSARKIDSKEINKIIVEYKNYGDEPNISEQKDLTNKLNETLKYPDNNN